MGLPVVVMSKKRNLLGMGYGRNTLFQKTLLRIFNIIATNPPRNNRKLLLSIQSHFLNRKTTGSSWRIK
jgi:hypothetical protein